MTGRRRFSRLEFVLALALLMTAGACGGPSLDTKEAALAVVRGVPDAAWKTLASRRVWFGHQSVGGNIMEGVAEIVAEAHLPLAAPVESRSPSALAAPGLFHALNGENEHPDLKIRAFAEFLDRDLQGHADIAFFKFCYVDIRPETDVTRLFADYRDTVDALRAKYPDVRIVHVTSPLTVVQPGWKVALKRLLGRPQKDYSANARRDAFNQRMLDAYRGKEPVFDLATVESTFPDGSRRTFEFDGRRYPALVEAYSDDGKHLDENGRRWVAAHLLATLAAIP